MRPKSKCRNNSTSLAKLRYLRYPIYFLIRLLDQRREVRTQMSRIEQTLNKPIVVLVVGVIAVALNVLLYFGYFLPKTTPLVEQIYSIGTSLPEAISKADSETGSKADPEASGKSGSADSGNSGSESSEESVPEESLNSVVSDLSPASPPNPPSDSPSGSAAEAARTQQQSSAPPQSPSGSLPELPPPPQEQPPTPAQVQY
jgi:hypothetical protein